MATWNKALGLAPGLGLLLAAGLAAATPAQAQTPLDSLDGLTGKVARYQLQALPEKLFLHLDRPLYLSGETMWFKLYAVEGTYSRPLPLSTVAYVEVLSPDQQPVLQAKVPLEQATGHGSFVLPPGLASGSYTVRAYTSWMKNFGPERYFQAPLTVVNPALASATKPAAPDSAAYDVEFFPEGGNLVQGLQSKVAFKVTDSHGRSAAAAGRVVDQHGRVVSTFATLRYGMGSFLFTPEAGATYSAVVTVGNKPVRRRPLPRSYAQGYVMRLESAGPDELTVSVAATTNRSETLFLLGHSRQKVVATARAQLQNGRAVFTLRRSQLLPGCSRLTVFNASSQPLCERLFFRPPERELAITARPDKAQFATREKVTLQMATTAPATASLSMAVYRLDSLTTGPTTAIAPYLWLTSELRGAVENPGYYLAATGPDAAEATENLLLTQGWSRFAWENVLTPTPFQHLPELNGPILQAQVSRAGAPLPGLNAYLTSPSRTIRLTNAVSNSAGLLRFEMGQRYGSQNIILQADPRQDSTCQLTLLPSFSEEYARSVAAPFMPLPRLQADYAKRYLQAQVQTAYSPLAAPVSPTPPTDSLAFYGKPDETYLLDSYTRFKVLEEVMREYVPGVLVRTRKDGFHLLVVDKVNKTVLSENPLVLLDGMPVFNINKVMALDPLKLRKLEVVASRYLHGRALYNGIVSFTTYQGDLAGFPLEPRALLQRYEGLQAQREFYAPRYATAQEKQSRRPDLRNLLYWNPSITTSGSSPQQVEFYTGDQAGRYLVVVQGLSDDGLAGSTSYVLEVKQAL